MKSPVIIGKKRESILDGHFTEVINRELKRFKNTWRSWFYRKNVAMLQKILGDTKLSYQQKKQKITDYFNDRKVFWIFHRGRKLQAFVNAGLANFDVDKKKFVQISGGYQATLKSVKEQLTKLSSANQMTGAKQQTAELAKLYL